MTVSPSLFDGFEILEPKNWIILIPTWNCKKKIHYFFRIINLSNLDIFYLNFKYGSMENGSFTLELQTLP